MFGGATVCFPLWSSVAVVFRGLEFKISYDMVRRVNYLVVEIGRASCRERV